MNAPANIHQRGRTVDAAQGKWRSILGLLGIDSSFLSGKHGPCPMCGGKDRFRFDDKKGRGTYFCSGCGAGTGMDLIQKVRGWDFRTAAAEVDKIVGSVSFEQPKPALDEQRRIRMLRELWKAGCAIGTNDAVAAYFASRKLPLPQNRSALRYVAQCHAPDRSVHPAMVAMVSAPDGKPATLHRTFLGPNGKADLDEPRAAMPGAIPDGAAIRLSMHGARLGIAEGIETALAASVLFDMPVWAAVNSTMLSKWRAPEGAREVVVFGDNDAKFGGAAAAYALAHRLVCRDRLSVEVRIPDRVGTDWADIHAMEAARAMERAVADGR